MTLLYRFRYGWLVLAGLVAIGLLSIPWLMHPLFARSAANQPMTEAWEKARAAGSYNFTSDVTQVTIPVATLGNVGRTNRTEKFYLEGQTDLTSESMEMTLWGQGGNVLQAASGLSIRTEQGKTLARRGNEAWREIDDVTGSLAPQGDFLAYLAAIKAVQAQPAEQRGGIHFTRYTFQIDSPRLAAYLHQQMEATMRARGELPPTLKLEIPAYFSEMVGSGELWIDQAGLPLRQILALQFPAQNDEQVHAQVVVDFSNFGQAGQGAAADGQSQAHWFAALKPGMVDFGLLYALPLLGGMALLLIYRRQRAINVAIVVLVIFAQVVGPILSTVINVRFMDAQTAKAAQQEAREATMETERTLREALGTVEFNPHLNPLERGDWRLERGDLTQESSLHSPSLLVSQSPSLQTTDTDGDGLTDFVETRIGTSAVISDTDSDGLLDPIEVNGFSFGGQQWYTNPEVADSNGDGLSDRPEWGMNADGTPLSTPLDTDGDGIPDLFDFDNDGDGVPDNKDLSPFAKGATAYNEAAPLQLAINNLTAGKPTFVEFQIRPQNAQQLWYAFNVLDWPQDSAGQMRDVDGKTYADIASGRIADASEANGDLKLIPMLEIRMPAASAQLPPQADLTPFNISVNNFTSDGATKVAYVPLNIITDEKTGQRVAFSGQMRYLPTGSWPSPHQVRLAWVVQALVDLPCDKAVDLSADCQADGYRNNIPQMLHSYYSDWSLTGLTVNEEHGADMAILYEDPAVDDNKKDDKAIWALAYALEGQFITGNDSNNNHQRDLTVADLAARFDRNNNPSAAQRMDVPNILQVETRSYATLDQAAASVAMTETGRILDTVFKSHVEGDRAIKPLLLFAQEQRSRGLSFDLASLSGDYVTQNGATLALNMSPTPETAQTVDVTIGMKWMSYCAPISGTVTLTPCDDDIYWETLEQRYAALAPLPDDEDPAWMGARLLYAQFYYTGLRTGFYTNVQAGSTILSSQYSLENESETASSVRAALRGAASVPLLAAQSFHRIFPGYIPGGTEAWNRGATLGYAAAIRKGIADAKGDYDAQIAKWGNTGRKIDAKTLADLTRKIENAKFLLRAYRVSIVGAAGAVVMVAAQIASLVPTLPLEARAALGGVALALNISFNIALPAVAYARLVGPALAAGRSIASVYNSLEAGSYRLAARGALIGAVIGTALVWGFFIYGAATSGLAAGNPELNRSFFESVAATVVVVLLSVLATNPIGAIIAAIIGVFDLLLTLICELGVNELRTVPGLGGACFTLTTAATKYLLYMIYNYDLMVDIGRGDLMVTGAPDVTLADPSKGYVAGNAISVAMPITTTLVHKNPDPSNGVLINGYLWLFSPANIRRNTFRYSLTPGGPATAPTALDQMPNEWQNVVEDHKYVLTPMYRGQAFTNHALPAYTPTAGLNRVVDFHINQGYAATAYECWMMWIPVTPIFFPVCYEREYKGENHVPISSLVYDIFPPTLDEFMAMTDAGNGSKQLAWDPAFAPLADADGDGLLASAFKGIDPNDNLVDSDGDGLTDRFELERQMGGVTVSPLLRDTDGDGLTDLQEMRLGTNPAAADSDNDGLLDGEEVRHLVYDANGSLTTAWAGGWQVTINTGSPFPVWVSSNPNSADSDNDGVSDLAERALAADPVPANRVDSAGVPYHPQVINKPPLTVYTDSDAFFGFIAPNQSIRYTTTVIANTAVAPGVLNVMVPSEAGVAPNPAPLAFNPSASVPQTVTLANNFTINPGAGTGGIVFTSTVNTRLAGSTNGGWAFEPVTPEAGLGNFASPTLAQGTTIAANRSDRQDGFRVAAKIAESAASLSKGDIFSADLLAGTNGLIDNDDNRMIQRGANDPDMACNNAGDCLVVWDEAELLGNGVVQGIDYSGFANGFTSDMASPGDRLLPINFNGDGNEDILYYRSGAATVGVYLSNGNGTLSYHALNNGGTPANGFLGDVTSDARDVLVPLNINGDAYDDILFYRPGGGVGGVFITNSSGTVTYLDYRQGGVSTKGFLGDLASSVDSLQPMDINGDGKDDLLYYRPGGGDAGVYIADSSGNGHLSYLVYRSNSQGNQHNFTPDMTNGYDRLVPLDINGDGFDDILYARPGGGYAGVHLADTSGNGYLTYVPYVTGSVPSNGWYPDMSSNYDIAIPLDINGDGKDDIFFARVGGGWAGVHLSNGDGTVTYVPYRNGGTGVHTNNWYPDMSSFEDRIVPMDQNGDGKDDLLFYRRGGGFAGIHLANPQGDGSLTYVPYRSPGTSSNGFSSDVASTADDAVPIDLNGDGRQDFLWVRPGGGYAAAYLAEPNTPVYRIGGALVGADGTVKARPTFPRRNPASLAHAALDRHPQVASDGTGFLVSYETVAPSLSEIHYIVTAGFDKDGNAVGHSVRNVNVVPRFEDRSLDSDMVWVGDRYRLVTKGRNLANIFIGDFNPNATIFPAGLVQVASDGLAATNASKIDTTPSLAYDPTSERWALAYIRGATDAPATVQVNRYPSVGSTTPDMNTTFSSPYERVNLAWQPQSRGWLFSGQLTDNRQVFGALAADLTGVTGDMGTSTQIGWTAADVPSSALACPAVTALPVLDLRFEELPGATTFVDSSGFGNNAICGGPTPCPTVAVSGAPNALLSDYGLGFNGNQYLRVADNAALDYDASESFTWMAWIKTASSSPILRKGTNGANDLMLSINGTGQLQMGFGNVTSNILYAGPTLRDNQWHHVAVTLNRMTGSATLYTDGVLRGSGNFTGNFTTSDDLLIGSGNTAGYLGQLDHLQFYNTALDATTISAIYNRTQQSYCVATSASSTNTNIQWARLRVTQIDTRGGPLSARASLKLTVDNDLPTASITSVPNNGKVGPGLIIAGTASDASAGVAFVQVSINSGPWQLATGANTWTFSLAGQTGPLSLQARAVDLVGNIGNASAPINLTVDGSAPAVTINPMANTVKPTRNASGQWQVNLAGTATDTSGISPNSVRVALQRADGVAQTTQTATLAGDHWNLTYLLDASLADPTGIYTATVQAEDTVGNRAAASTLVRLDATGPTANLNAADAMRTVISQTLTIGGVVSDTNSIAGIDKVEIAFTPVEQIAALSPGLTAEEAEATLNRTWTPVTLAQRGEGVATTDWSFAIPTGLENIYQLDLRATDMLGNVLISAGLWRGMIDTTDPRVVMTAEVTGTSYLDIATNQRRHQVRFVCAAVDRNLIEASFVCPGQAIAETVRTFTALPALETLFPDLALRTGLAISYTQWVTVPAPAVQAAACDNFGRCAEVTTPVDINGSDPGAATTPTAVVISPSAGDYVAASGQTTLKVAVAAEAAGLLKTVTLLLDGNNVDTINFAQGAQLTTAQRTFSIPLPSQGPHTLAAQATDWAGATQTTLLPVPFQLDSEAPTVTLDTVEVGTADTWALGSGILQFRGSASDTVGLAAVQVKVGIRPWIDAAFSNGSWHIAYPVPAPEGQTLTVLVRAIDLAGQSTEISRAVPVDLSSTNPPNTSLTTTPGDSSSGPAADFAFTGTAGSLPVAGFACSLDGADYTICYSPLTVQDLSKGMHTLAVRAIDSAGFVDLSPATHQWTVTGGPLDVTITAAPADPTAERTATFAFSAAATSFECRLDNLLLGLTGSYTPCVSGVSYPNLADGNYVFFVRGLNGEQRGLATRHAWTVNNLAPVANNQTVTTEQESEVAVTLTATDVDALTYRVMQLPAHGILTGVAPELIYTPNTDFYGNDSFTFQANDGQTSSLAATVTITVEERGLTIGQCGVYTVRQLSNGSYTARGWTGKIIVGTAAPNNITGTADPELILGLGGNDILNGKAGDDVICGGEGNDLLYGELGTDYLDGGNHNDVLNSGTGDYDVLIGGDGNDTLLDPDGGADLRGGPGNDQINLSLRNGWRTPDNKIEFVQRFAAGLGNDTVTFGILGSDTFTVDITGDEWEDMPGEGNADTIRFAGRINQADSHFRKFEGQVIIATSELPVITDETGFEFWEDVPVEETPIPEQPGQEEPAPPINEPLSHQLYLPVIGK